MEKSIENIWKEGFLKRDALIAPQVNQLYERKSIHLIEKFESAFTINIKAIIIAGILLCIASTFIGAFWAGSLIMLMLFYVAYTAKQELDALKQLRKNDNSYRFLKAFKAWIDRSTLRYGRMYRWFYPLLLLSFYFGLWYSDLLSNIRMQLMESGEALLWGTHLYTSLGIIGFALFMSLFSKAIHRFDVKLIYGGIIRRLEAAIADMEELRENN